jgi:hypothetical protein
MTMRSIKTARHKEKAVIKRITVKKENLSANFPKNKRQLPFL